MDNVLSADQISRHLKASFAIAEGRAASLKLKPKSTNTLAGQIVDLAIAKSNPVEIEFKQIDADLDQAILKAERDIDTLGQQYQDLSLAIDTLRGDTAAANQIKSARVKSLVDAAKLSIDAGLLNPASAIRQIENSIADAPERLHELKHRLIASTKSAKGIFVSKTKARIFEANGDDRQAHVYAGLAEKKKQEHRKQFNRHNRGVAK